MALGTSGAGDRQTVCHSHGAQIPEEFILRSLRRRVRRLEWLSWLIKVLDFYMHENRCRILCLAGSSFLLASAGCLVSVSATKAGSFVPLYNYYFPKTLILFLPSIGSGSIKNSFLQLRPKVCPGLKWISTGLRAVERRGFDHLFTPLIGGDGEFGET